MGVSGAVIGVVIPHEVEMDYLAISRENRDAQHQINEEIAPLADGLQFSHGNRKRGTVSRPPGL
jgi:hypothetical protein